MSYVFIILIGIIQILTLAICGYLWCYLYRQEKYLNKFTQKIESKIQDIKIKQEEEDNNNNKDFKKEFYEANIKASRQMAGGYEKIPEKYKYVVSVAEQGMGIEDLAKTFGISSYEVEQLVNLSRLAKNSQS